MRGHVLMLEPSRITRTISSTPVEMPKYLAHTKRQSLDHLVPIDVQVEIRRVKEAIWSSAFANLRYDFSKVNTTK